MSLGLIYHEDYHRHETGSHPERKERLDAILGFLAKQNYYPSVTRISPRPATVEEILSVHDQPYMDTVRALAAHGGGWLDADTYVSPASFDVALLAAGGVLTALEAVMAGKVNSAFALVRPPGHHAEPNRGMGFCLFNNIAICGEQAKRKYGLTRILIVDWDVHHGNGTQFIFYRDPGVLFFSVHQRPLYPGTGATNEVGWGEGKGYTVNAPLPPTCGDKVYDLVFQEILVPIADQYKPELVLVSAGFDAHFADPIGNMRLTAAGYARLCQHVVAIADKWAGGRMIFSLEGGYSLKALGPAVGAVLAVLSGHKDLPEDVTGFPGEGSLETGKKRIEEIKQAQSQYWSL